MPTNHNDPSLHANAIDGLKAMFNPVLLTGTGITVLAYEGSLALYTYISPILLQVMHEGERTCSLLMLGMMRWLLLGMSGVIVSPTKRTKITLS